MPNFETEYMGLTLKNPIVAASSGMTSSFEKLVQLEKHGVGAIVLKSLFEEQINNEVSFTIDRNSQANHHPTGMDYISSYVRENSLHKYVELIHQAKSNLTVPIIASLNCLTAEEWVSYARELKDAGADALEINAFVLPCDRKSTASDIEYKYLDILTEIKKKVKIPVAMKIGNNFTNIINFSDKLHANGASAVVLFNRFYEPDINIETMQFQPAAIYSTPSEMRQALRWVGLVSGKVHNLDVAASTGIHDGEAVIKQLLAGAKVTQICSTLYLNGYDQIDKMLADLRAFMIKWNFKKISEFRGRLSYNSISHPVMYERAQFMKYFSGHHPV